MFLLQFFFLLLFGLLTGTFGTMLGIGGGFIYVPFLMLVFNFMPQDAIGTSIGIIFFNTLAGTLVYYFQKQMDFDLAKKLSLAAIPGAFVGPLIVQHYSNLFFSLGLAILLAFIAYYLYFKGGERDLAVKSTYQKPAYLQEGPLTYSVNLHFGLFGTFIIGFLSNLFGVGGGVIHVPFMIIGLNMPIHLALGTSHFILCVSSFIGMMMFFFLGNVQVDFMMPISLGAIIGARIGAAISLYVLSSVIRKILAGTLVFVIIKLILDAIFKY